MYALAVGRVLSICPRFVLCCLDRVPLVYHSSCTNGAGGSCRHLGPGRLTSSRQLRIVPDSRISPFPLAIVTIKYSAGSVHADKPAQYSDSSMGTAL